MPESATAARSAYATIRFEQDGHVGRLTLTRPEKLNSFTLEMWRELRELGEELLRDPGDLRALVVIGEGRAFSSGIDTSVFSEPRSAADLIADGATRHDDPTVAGVLAAQDSYSWLEEAPFATVAAVRAYALGAGLQLALACDIRVMARGTKVGLLEFKYGIIPDLGGTQRLPRLVGAAKAKELIFTAAQIDADEAARIGLAEHVVADEELEEVADGLARSIAAQPPLAVRAAKRAVNVAMSGASVSDGLVIEAEGQATCLRSDDMREAVTAFLEQRTPEYRGR
jgi:enoyl-CoA hydratase/carnithine racemase